MLDAFDDLLGGLEVEYLAHEPLDEPGVLDRDQGVVDPVGADPAHVARPGLGVDGAGFGAGELHVGVELDGVFGGQREAQPVADLVVLPGAEPTASFVAW